MGAESRYWPQLRMVRMVPRWERIVVVRRRVILDFGLGFVDLLIWVGWGWDGEMYCLASWGRLGRVCWGGVSLLACLNGGDGGDLGRGGGFIRWL